MLDTEARLLRAAAQTGAPKVAPERAAAALGRRPRAGGGAAVARARPSRRGGCGAGAADAPGGADAPLSGAGLTDDQVQAAYGVLTSGRAIDILVGAAGHREDPDGRRSSRRPGRRPVSAG